MTTSAEVVGWGYTTVLCISFFLTNLLFNYHFEAPSRSKKKLHNKEKEKIIIMYVRSFECSPEM